MTEAAAARTRPLVLAADDDEDILALVAFRLERAGYSALHAELRPAALALLAGDGVQPPALGPAAAEVFAELLAHYARALSGPEHERIAKYFEATGAVDAQLRRLHSRLGWRRASAAFALGDMGSERAVPGLLRALGDDDRGVRNAAARSLGRLRAVAAIEPLVAAGVARRVPRAVINAALFEIGPAAVPGLRELAAHPDPVIRADGVELLGLLGERGRARSPGSTRSSSSAPPKSAAPGRTCARRRIWRRCERAQRTSCSPTRSPPSPTSRSSMAFTCS